MKLFNYDNVLCLSPHPDDVEFSMSGTIKKYNQTHFIVLVLSNGTTGDKTSGLGRIKEVQKFWELLDVDNVTILTTSHKFDKMDDGSWINIIENELTLPKLDAIFGTSSEDSHYEHHIVNRLLHSLGRNKKVSLFEYRSPSTIESWEPNFFVDIDESYKFKLRSLLGSFNSQLDSPYFKNQLIDNFNSNYIMSKLGFEKIENYKIIRKILKG